MKKINFLLFCLIVIFSFNINVKAGVVCGSDNENAVHINMHAAIDNAKYDVKIPTCVFTKEIVGWESIDLGNANQYNPRAVDAEGYEKIDVAQEDAYAKGIVNLIVAKCDDPKAKLHADVYCSKNICDATPKQDCLAYKCKKYKNGKCVERYTSTHYCTKWSDVYYVCDGCSGGGDSVKVVGKKCAKYRSYTYEVPREKAGSAISVVQMAKGSDGKFLASGYDAIDDCAITFTLLCPKYKCQYQERIINACTPGYDVGGSAAYCVNPAQAFPHDGNNNNYQVDTGFNVNDCATSYSTVDCGYGNILVEAEYYKSIGKKVSDSAINTALRLWGAYTNQAGYGKTGLANRTGASCGEGIVFIPRSGGGIVNVYKATVTYINDNFKSIAYSRKYSGVNDELRANFNKITCDAGLGITCSSTYDSTVYGQAINLFFNTVIGNKDLHNHIKKLFGATNTNPDNSNIVTGETSNGYTKTWIEFQYEEFENLGVTQEIYDSKEDRENKEKKYTKEEREEILPYCEVKVALYDSADKKTRKLIKGPDGKVYNDIAMSECIKGSGCVTEEFEIASCERRGNASTKVYAEITYEENEAGSVLRKYWACASNGVDDDSNQVLFSFKKNYKPYSSDSSKPITKRIEEYTLSCGGTCIETGVNRMSNSGYADGKCVDKLSGEYKNESTFDNSIKDPSLKCIVNMAENLRDYYDYSAYFGVNSNLCKVYCSDEVVFTLSNKINAAAGETFL